MSLVPENARASTEGRHRRLRLLLREPLLHFLAIGGTVFALYSAGDRPGSAPSKAVIAVTPVQVERLAGQFEAVWRRPPTQGEMAGIVEDFVRDEVYYREALALGLDRDDTVIRQRLRQKMEFLSDTGAEVLTPTDEELRAHYVAQPDRFTAPARVTFQQVFLGDADPAVALAELAAGAEPANVGRGSLLPPIMEAAVATAVDGTFGDGFFDAVAKLPPGDWQGPVRSGLGVHLVRLVEAEPAVAPPFEVVRSEVERDWRLAAETRLRELQYRALRERYEVVLPAPADSL